MKNIGKNPEKSSVKLGNPLGNTRDIILYEMNKNPHISAKKLAEILEISTTAIEKNIKYLRETGIIERVGGTRGYWKIINR